MRLYLGTHFHLKIGKNLRQLCELRLVVKICCSGKPAIYKLGKNFCRHRMFDRRADKKQAGAVQTSLRICLAHAIQSGSRRLPVFVRTSWIDSSFELAASKDPAWLFKDRRSKTGRFKQDKVDILANESWLPVENENAIWPADCRYLAAGVALDMCLNLSFGKIVAHKVRQLVLGPLTDRIPHRSTQCIATGEKVSPFQFRDISRVNKPFQVDCGLDNLTAHVHTQLPRPFCGERAGSQGKLV